MRAIVGAFIVSLALCVPSARAVGPDSQPGDVENTGDVSRQQQVKPIAGIVVDDQGQPISGADVVFQPGAKGKKFKTAARSDDDGRFQLSPPPLAGDAWPPGTLWAGASNRRLACQRLFGDEAPPPSDELRLVLPMAANVPVTVQGPDGQPLAGAQVSPTMAVRDIGGGLPLPEELVSLTQATTDVEGVAKLWAVAAEEIASLRVSTPEYGVQSLFLGQQPGKRPKELTIKLKPVGRVRGRLVAPQADLIRATKVALTSYPSDMSRHGMETTGWATAVTDAEGRFEVPVLAQGVIRYIFVECQPERGFLPVPPEETPLAAGQTVELTIPFRPAVHIHGTVQDQTAGKPMTGATVALFRERGGSSGAVWTDVKGRFDFWQLPGSYDLLVSIKPRGAPVWSRQRDIQVAGGVNELQLPPIAFLLTRGRVVDDAGRGWEGAKIKTVVSKIESEGQAIEAPVRWSSELRSLSTDADGRYQAWVEAAAYRVQIEADSHTPQWTEWTDFTGDAPPVFPDVVITKLQSVAGRVVDRQGRAVVGAMVIQSGDGPQRTETTSGDDGRFELAGYQSGPAFVFAVKDGFRFHGQRVEAGAVNAQIVLTRTSEPPARRLTNLAQADAAADLSLARQVLAPALRRKPTGPDDHDQWLVLRELAAVDPAAALDRLEASGLTGGRAQMVRALVAKRWAAEHPDDAMAIIEALDDSYSRVLGYIQLVEALPTSQSERKIEWLGKARFELRGLPDPTMRAALGSGIARLLMESGADDAGRMLIGELRSDVEKLPLDGFAGYARGAAAEALATTDLAAALALIKDLKQDREFDRHHGNISRILASSQPADALRVLKLLRDDFRRDRCAVQVAYFAAPFDRERADDAAELISLPQLKAFAQALIATALSKDDQPAAMARIESTYQALADLNLDDKNSSYNDYHLAPVLAAWLLPVIETIDPDRVDEFLWRAISLRAPLASQGQSAATSLRSRAYLAMFLSRYDGKLAGELYGNLIDEAAVKLVGWEFAGIAEELYGALAMIDPERAVAMFEKLADDAPNNAKTQARGGMVAILPSQGEARWRAASGFLRLWMPWTRIE